MTNPTNKVEKAKRDPATKRSTGTHPQRRPRSPRRRLIGEGTKCTPETVEKICEAVRLGAPLDVARGYGGVPAPTFIEWMRQGRDGWEPYVSFVEKLDEAMHEGQMRDIRRVDAGAEKDWRASAFKLERRFPEHWGEKKQIDTTVTGKPFVDLSKLTLEEKLQLQALLTKASPESADLPAGAVPAGELLAASVDGEVVSEEEVA